ncbi:four helix bundle protein [Pseudidiomarina atlantica]|jgi:four helix bundle protein|uniref:four helix bundle protein n=1 Tax=Pseudidiomarina atlantica TaxID=1517416 RepID=UPI0005516E5F|nr:four helix bundle protein [Pseudidiomarina atlantica]
MEVEVAERLIAIEVGIELCVYVYALTKDFPRDERYGLTSQIRRSAVSIPSNIAEGSNRHSLKDFLRFMHIAKGSLAELETQLIIAVRLGYIDDFANDLISRVLKLINALIRSLNYRITNND